MLEQNEVQTGFADISGGRMYYEVAGDGPALVLLHAGIADQRMWDDQFLAFAQYYRVIRCDLWGYGKSTAPAQAYALYQDVYQLLQLLGVEQAHLLGCSGGGAVSIDLALAYPHLVKSLIVAGSGLGGYQFTGEAIQRSSEQMHTAWDQKDFAQLIEVAASVKGAQG